MESWLLELLCLNAAEHVPKLPARLPHPSECDLYYINRDTLFSYHKVRHAWCADVQDVALATCMSTPTMLHRTGGCDHWVDLCARGKTGAMLPGLLTT